MIDLPKSVVGVVVSIGLLAMGSLPACSRGKQAFLSARMCLSSLDDIAALKNLLASTAPRYNLEYIDRSRDTERELGAVGDDALKRAGFVLNAGTWRKDGMGVTAMQMGRPGYQVALGFSEGKNPAVAHRYSEELLSRFCERWPVETFAGSVGLQLFPRCG